MGATEIAAAALGAAYILLAIRRLRACWIAGGASTALYLFVLAEAGLPLQAGLQLLYVALAVYGWMAWRPGGGAPARPQPWHWRSHAAWLGAVALAALPSAWLLASRGWSEAPVADALGTWASVAATWMTARRCIESWLWWIAIDLGLAALFWTQGLAPTAALYLAYALLAVAGWFEWRRAAAA